METAEFQFESKEEYERALEDMLDPANRGGSPCRAAMAAKDLEAYDQLVDEYLKFCETNGE